MQNIITILAGMSLSLGAAVQAEMPDANPPYDTIEATSVGEQFQAWTKHQLNGEEVFVSPVIDSEAGTELNHHRVKAVFEGTGSLQVTVAHHSAENLAKALATPHLTRPLKTVKSGQEIRFSLPYKGQRFTWVLLKPSGQVSMKGLRLRSWKGTGTLYGHVGTVYLFDGGKLPYRLLYPRNYDPRKRYPLVLSVSGSGGVGADNRRNMEMVILARYLFTRWWFEEEFACFSLVPQIPTKANTPEGWWPNGEKGGPDGPWHPDWAAVNEDSWYTQGTISLIKDLIQDRSISIDPDRIYFSGFSYGGKAIWEFLKADRELFAAGIGVAGWPIGRAYSKPEGKLLERLKKEVQRYKHVPVMVMAGQKDRMRYGSKTVSELINQAGGKSTYVEFEGATHVQSAGRAWGNRKHMEWLFSQNRRKNPRPGPDPYPNGNYENDPEEAGN